MVEWNQGTKIGWQRWDSNPRPRRDWCLKPAHTLFFIFKLFVSALDRSATLPINIRLQFGIQVNPT